MYRHWVKPRQDWRRTIQGQGMIFPTTPTPDGGEVPYWDESAMYEFASDEIDQLEQATADLHRMSTEAARFLMTGAMGDLGLPKGSLALASESLSTEPPTLHGRFDLVYGGDGPAKLLEYNADTPVTLLESGAIQWYWLNDKFPNTDQWNHIHEDLINQWHFLSSRLRSRTVHFAHGPDAPLEDLATSGYLRDTAAQAGLITRGLAIDEIGYDHDSGYFVDDDHYRIDVLYKLYPWSDMLWEPFGQVIRDHPDNCQWIEPVWKVVMASKALLPALWHLYPDHPNLLPAHLAEPGTLAEWVAKPLHGREGEGIVVHAKDARSGKLNSQARQHYIFQQWCPLPDFEGNHPVIGSWIVGDRPAGAGIRESDGWITDIYARFIPHVIDAPRPAEPEPDPLS